MNENVPTLNLDYREKDLLAQSAVNYGLSSNIFLAIIKTIIGIFGHSPALLADGINSTSDVAYYIAVKIFMKVAEKPADKEHPFGHRQMESIAALVIGAFILTTAVAIFWNAINDVYDILSNNVQPTQTSYWALVIALFTVGLKIFLTIYTKNIGKKIHNPTVTALACDHINDIYASSAASIGIFAGLQLHLYWIDPLAGAVVAFFILRTGIEIIKDASSGLMDVAPDPEFHDQIQELANSIPEIKELGDCQSHRFGAYFVLNMVIGIPGNLTVTQGDQIADQFESLLFSSFANLIKVNIHYHPYEKCSFNDQ